MSENLDKHSGLTEQEKIVMDHLIDAWNEFVRLPIQHPSDSDEAKQAIHELQKLLALRIVRRLYPEEWYRQKV